MHESCFRGDLDELILLPSFRWWRGKSLCFNLLVHIHGNLKAGSVFQKMVLNGLLKTPQIHTSKPTSSTGATRHVV